MKNYSQSEKFIMDEIMRINNIPVDPLPLIERIKVSLDKSFLIEKKINEIKKKMYSSSALPVENQTFNDSSYLSLNKKFNIDAEGKVEAISVSSKTPRTVTYSPKVCELDKTISTSKSAESVTIGPNDNFSIAHTRPSLLSLRAKKGEVTLINLKARDLNKKEALPLPSLPAILNYKKHGSALFKNRTGYAQIDKPIFGKKISKLYLTKNFIDIAHSAQDQSTLNYKLNNKQLDILIIKNKLLALVCFSSLYANTAKVRKYNVGVLKKERVLACASSLLAPTLPLKLGGEQALPSLRASDTEQKNDNLVVPFTNLNKHDLVLPNMARSEGKLRSERRASPIAAFLSRSAKKKGGAGTQRNKNYLEITSVPNNMSLTNNNSPNTYNPFLRVLNAPYLKNKEGEATPDKNKIDISSSFIGLKAGNPLANLALLASQDKNQRSIIYLLYENYGHKLLSLRHLLYKYHLSSITRDAPERYRALSFNFIKLSERRNTLDSFEYTGFRIKKNISTLLKYFFFSIGKSLISKPFFIFQHNKVIIQLDFYLNKRIFYTRKINKKMKLKFLPEQLRVATREDQDNNMVPKDKVKEEDAAPFFFKGEKCDDLTLKVRERNNIIVKKATLPLKGAEDNIVNISNKVKPFDEDNLVTYDPLIHLLKKNILRFNYAYKVDFMLYYARYCNYKKFSLNGLFKDILPFFNKNAAIFINSDSIEDKDYTSITYGIKKKSGVAFVPYDRSTLLSLPSLVRSESISQSINFSSRFALGHTGFAIQKDNFIKSVTLPSISRYASEKREAVSYSTKNLLHYPVKVSSTDINYDLLGLVNKKISSASLRARENSNLSFFRRNVGRLQPCYVESKKLIKNVRKKYSELKDLVKLVGYYKLVNKKRKIRKIISPLLFNNNELLYFLKGSSYEYLMKNLLKVPHFAYGVEPFSEDYLIHNNIKGKKYFSDIFSLDKHEIFAKRFSGRPHLNPLIKYRDFLFYAKSLISKKGIEWIPSYLLKRGGRALLIDKINFTYLFKKKHLPRPYWGNSILYRKRYLSPHLSLKEREAALKKSEARSHLRALNKKKGQASLSYFIIKGSEGKDDGKISSSLVTRKKKNSIKGQGFNLKYYNQYLKYYIQYSTEIFNNRNASMLSKIIYYNKKYSLRAANYSIKKSIPQHLSRYASEQENNNLLSLPLLTSEENNKGKARSLTLKERATDKKKSVALIFINKEKKLMFFLNSKLNALTYILEKFFNRPVHLEITRLKYPYSDSNMVAQIFGLMGKRKSFERILIGYLQAAVIFNPVESLSEVSFTPKYKNSIISKLSGVRFRLAGRFYRGKIVPRKTVFNRQVGSLARGAINYVDSSKYINKSKRGSFCVTISVSHAF